MNIKIFIFPLRTSFGLFLTHPGHEKGFKTNIRVEKEATKHYNKLLGTVDWDQDTAQSAEKKSC
jgi:hypothetical protein